MNRTLLALMLAVCSVSSAQVQYPYNPDAEPDGLIGVGDILSVLAIFGQEYNLGTLQSDSSSAILYVGDMDFWDCKSSCTSLEGNWRVLDDYLVGTYRATLSELGQVWYCAPHLSQGYNESNSNPFLTDGSYSTYTSRSATKSCVCQTRTSPLVNEINPCAALEDECGVCQGVGAIYECGCFDIPEGDCDCDGNQLDALGVCGGGCPLDVDGDGICDPICGNGVVEGEEMCDDGNENPNDGCDGCVEVWACGDSLEYEGVTYPTVQMGSQCWFAADLKAKINVDGDPIDQIFAGPFPQSTSLGPFAYGDKLCCMIPKLVDFLEFDSNAEPITAGYEHTQVLYNGKVAFDNLVCPSGWSVPTRSDWSQLISSIGTGSSELASLIDTNNPIGPDFFPTFTYGSSGFSAHAQPLLNSSGEPYTTSYANSYYWSRTPFGEESVTGELYIFQLQDEGFKIQAWSSYWMSALSFRPIRCMKDQ